MQEGNTAKDASLSSTRDAGRFEFLDVCRGLAAMCVVIYHAFQRMSPATDLWLMDREDLGSMGVFTFFFVSGFVIPMSMQRYSLLQFWRSRFFRLFPAYWAASVATLLLFFLGWKNVPAVFAHWDSRLYLSNLFMVSNAAHEPGVLPQNWTLNVELYFYLLCTLLALIKVLGKRLQVALGAIAVYALWFAAASLHLISADHFKGASGLLILAALIGSVCYGIERGEIDGRTLYYLLPIFVVCMLTGMRYDYLPNHNNPAVHVPYAPRVVSWFEAIALFFGLFLLRKRRFPAPLLWLGRISYSLYLTHLLLLYTVGRMPHILPMIAVPVAVLLSLPLADLSYRFVERPFLSLAKGAHRNQVVTPNAPILS